jgi:predicted transcriptional regulator
MSGSSARQRTKVIEVLVHDDGTAGLIAAAKAEFEGSSALREEFIDLATYTVWRKATAAGKVRVFRNQAG